MILTDDIQFAARDLMTALSDARIDAVLGGAMAYGYWGVPRGTLDIDVTVFVDLDRIESVFPVLEALGARFDRSRALDVAQRRGVFEVELRSFRVDVFVPDIPLYAAARERRRRVRFLDVELLVWAPEDITLFKLLYFRPKDKLDIENIIQIQQENVDLGYIRRWLVDLVGAADERAVWFESAVARWMPARMV